MDVSKDAQKPTRGRWAGEQFGEEEEGEYD